VRLDGIGINRPDWHGALQRHLEKVLSVTDPPRERPREVIFDWSPVETTTAEGLAYFLVLTHRLHRQGHVITVCEPSCADLREAVQSLGLSNSIPAIRWVSDPPIDGRRLRAIGRPGLFGGSRKSGNAGAFLDELERELATMKMSQPPLEILVAFSMEVIQNIRSHAGASVGSAFAVLEQHRRPPRIQLGFADDGAGIASHVLQQMRHENLAAFTDMTVVTAVLSRALSGRDSDSGGGFSRLCHILTEDHNGSVWVRSGAALLQLQPGTSPRGARLAAGSGTQIRVTLPLG